MAGPAATFARESPAIESAEVVTAGEFVHVYRGQLAADDRVARLLVGAPEHADEQPVRTAFDRAADQWERLDWHPNVVSVHDRGTAPRPWLAVEDVGGQRLATAAANLSPDEARRVAADAAEVLREAESADCGPSALTPETVWVVHGGAEATTRLDWGIERACRVAAGETPDSPYTAPDNRADPATSTGPAGVYALGALLYYAAIGRPPTGPESSGQPERDTPGRSLDGTDAGLPPALGAVLATALAADPADRYATPYEFKLAVLFDSHGPTDAGGPGAASTAGGESEAATEPGGSTPDTEKAASALKPGRRTVLGALGLAAVGGGLLAGTQLDRLGSSSDDPAAAGSEPDPAELPEAAFEFRYDRERGSLTVVHAGGEPLRAGRLVVRSEDLAVTPVQWSDDPDYGPRSSVTTGESIAVDAGAEPPFSVTVAWEDSGRTAQLGSLQVLGTTEIDVSSRGDRPPNASFSIEYGGQVLRVSHQSGQSVSADRLFVRGARFSGAPEVTWGDEPGYPSGGSVSPGDSLELSAGEDAVARLVWEREGGPEVTTANPEGVLSRSGPDLGTIDSRVVLAQFQGPARPLQPGLGGAPTGRYNARNTGFGERRSGPTAGVTEDWRRSAGSDDRSVSIAVGSLAPAPAVSDGTVYAGGADGNLYALDAVDGAELWRVASGPFASATVAGDTVYVGGTAVRAVAASDGTEQWAHGIDGAVSGPPRVLDEVIYASFGYPFNWRVRAIAASDGSETWTVPTDGGAIRPPAIADRTVYVSGGDLRALGATDGTEQWRYETGALLTAPAVADSTVYVGESGGSGATGHITALDGEDGSVQWRRETGGPMAGTLTVTDEAVYAAGSTGTGGFVAALDRQNGTARWTRGTEIPVRNPSIVASGVLYVADEAGVLHGLAAESGTQQFVYDTGDTVLGSPTATNNSLYLVGEEQSVHALAASTVD